MSDLKTNLQEILQEKQDKIIPENIKSGVTILGVNGTLETGTDNELVDTSITFIKTLLSKPLSKKIETSDITSNGSDVGITNIYYFGGTIELVDNTTYNQYNLNTMGIFMFVGIKDKKFDATITYTFKDIDNTTLFTISDITKVAPITQPENKMTQSLVVLSTSNRYEGTQEDLEILRQKLLQIQDVEMNINITNIDDLGIDTSDANATVNDIAIGKTAYVSGEKVTGILPLFPNSRTFTVDGGITNDTENNRIQIHTINTTKQILDSNLNMEFNGEYADVADAIGLTANKIKAGETILGVTGTMQAGIDTSDATATANDIVQNKTAYVNGEKITGAISEVKENASIGGIYNGPRYDDSTNTIYIEHNEDTNVYSFKYDIDDDIVLRQGAIINYQMRSSGLSDYFGVSTEKIKSGETIMGISGSFDTEYMPNGFGDNDTTYYVEGDSSWTKDQEILVPYYDTGGSISKNFAFVGNYAVLNYRQMNEMTVENTGYILTEVLSDMEIGTDTTLAVKLKIKEILLPNNGVEDTEVNFE